MSIFLQRLSLLFAMFGSTIASTQAQSDSSIGYAGEGIPPSRIWLATPNDEEAAWDPRSPRIETVHVASLDEREIVGINPTNGAQIKFNSAQLQAIEVNWNSESALKAHQTFIAGDYMAAIEQAKGAIRANDIPRWQQKILAAEMVDSLVGLKQYGAAGRVYLSLSKESIPAILFASMPLNWMNDRPDTLLLEQAKEWHAAKDSEAALLLGASWLLGGPESSAAQRSLESIARNPASIHAKLAAAQLWRIASPKEVIANAGLWKSVCESLVPPLQVGPSITLAYKLERAGMKESALDEWLRASQLVSPEAPLGKRIAEHRQFLLSELYPKSSTSAAGGDKQAP